MTLIRQLIISPVEIFEKKNYLQNTLKLPYGNIKKINFSEGVYPGLPMGWGGRALIPGG